MTTPLAIRHLRSVPASDEADGAAMLAGLAEGDRAAARAFFDRFQRDVNRLVWALLGGDREHDDLVQETFEALFKSVHSVTSAAALTGWVRSVTVNTVRNALRRRRWRRLFTREEEGLEIADATVPDEGRREAARRVWSALARLDPDERVLLILRNIEGYELTECAEATRCSLATVKRRLDRASAKLRTLLEGTEA